ncbi:MAG: 2-oxoacid:acceptor oxidoreductase family protein [Kiritimatiellia bacterium]|jgi:2-oxoglutarate ferredoxin oxidoreductase subunit gamma|nr:2-oxoacid:acceptor oxidoreductase family protein [Kiritimatiellia bacterium]MDP6809182.1 2-oxoacid:acceptor oxidoreductase family protein [Kiritimatiellia bacterium]
MLERVLIAGSGGQGILLIGRILARAGMLCVPHVTYFPAYGAEVRGGTSNCQIVLSDEEIHSPVPSQFEAMLILNQESAQRFIPRRTDSTKVILNTSLCQAPDLGPVTGIKATDIATDLGEIRATNFIMMGAYLATNPCIPAESLEACIRKELAGKPDAIIDLNIEALEIGLNHQL